MKKCKHDNGYFTEIQDSLLERNIESDGSIYCNCNSHSPKWLKIGKFAYA